MSSLGDRVGALVKALKTSDRSIRVTWMSPTTGLTISFVGKLDDSSSGNLIFVKGNAPGDLAHLSLIGPDVNEVEKPSGVLLEVKLAGGGLIRLTETDS